MFTAIYYLQKFCKNNKTCRNMLIDYKIAVLCQYSYKKY